MKEQVLKLREEMEKNGINAYLIPTTDFHGSEYVNEYFKCREFISGFTGSNGTLLVTNDEAKLWTDGRYFLQAAQQLEGSGIELMKMGESGVPTIEEYLKEILNEDDCLGFDGRVIDCALGYVMEKHCQIEYGKDLVDGLWADRPALNPSKVYELDLNVTGETTESKLARVRSMMAEKGADYHLISRLEDIAWLYNLRGRDVKHTPVFFAYALITMDDDRLYMMDRSYDGRENLPYEQVYEDLKKLPEGKILLDENVVSYAAVKSIAEGVEIINGNNPCELMKCIKNDTEINSTLKAHIKDGVAMVNFLFWLKKNVGKIPMSEISVADYLYDLRMEQEGCFDLSFVTISGYMENGAIIHYTATEKTNKEIQPEGFLLVDSGGQYEEGTTDITRTIAVGPLTDEMRKHYTAVLLCNIKLATARFAEGTVGLELDNMTRKPLQDMGLDYKHGTGHGVGHLLSVHEGPATINPRCKGFPVLPGMIMSDEPGVYLAGQYGIRLENEMLYKRGADGMIEAEAITFCPFEREALDLSMMDDEAKKWLNDYHKMVEETLMPYLDEEVGQWLKTQTAAI